MDSFLFAVNAVSPIILTVVIGYLLKKAGLITQTLAKAMNKLVFRVFLPSMLFLNVYNISDIGTMDFGYVVYGAVIVLAIFMCALPAVTAAHRV